MIEYTWRKAAVIMHKLRKSDNAKCKGGSLPYARLGPLLLSDGLVATSLPDSIGGIGQRGEREGSDKFRDEPRSDLKNTKLETWRSHK